MLNQFLHDHAIEQDEMHRPVFDVGTPGKATWVGTDSEPVDFPVGAGEVEIYRWMTDFEFAEITTHLTQLAKLGVCITVAVNPVVLGEKQANRLDRIIGWEPNLDIKHVP